MHIYELTQQAPTLIAHGKANSWQLVTGTSKSAD